MNDNKKQAAPRRGGMFGGPPGGGVVEKPKDFKGTIKKLFKYIGDSKIALIFVAVCALASVLFNVVGPKVLGGATNELKDGITKKITGTGGIDFEKIAQVLIIVLLLYLVSAAFTFIQGFLMTGITQKTSYKLRREISEKIARMPMKYFESRPYGEVLSRITNDVDTLGNGMNQSITQLITSVATIIGVIIMMLSISPRMTIIALLTIPLSISLIAAVVKKSQKYFKTQQKYLGDINGQVEEVYSGQMVIKAFSKENDVVKTFKKTNDSLYDSAWKSQFFSGMMFPIMGFVGNLGYVAVAIVGAFLVISGKIFIGDIQAFIMYVRNLNQPIQQFAQIASMLQSMMAAAERVFEFLDEPEEDNSSLCNTLDMINIKGNIEFDNVKFGYDESKIIINDFTSRVKPGQKIAIVGPTGAGKSTIVKLLMRFYDVNSGAIKLDGVNINNYSRADIRSAFGMVLQDTWLFGGTILENIRYGKLDATNEEVIAAAKSAHAHHFINTLPDGYNMVLNEETSNISQGQKQLLTIARAILADRPLLILDEATSSVDTLTEIRIQRAMDNLMRGRTSFVIAHRLSTIKGADLILVMKDGDIIEQGTHAELITKGDFYSELYNSQFEQSA